MINAESRKIRPTTGVFKLSQFVGDVCIDKPSAVARTASKAYSYEHGNRANREKTLYISKCKLQSSVLWYRIKNHALNVAEDSDKPVKIQSQGEHTI